MAVLDHFAQAAAVLLLIELLVVILLFLGISGGLAFGLRWVVGKTDWSFSKLNEYLAMGQRYVHIGTDYAAKPIISADGLAATVRAALQQLQHDVQTERNTSPSHVVAARPVPPPADPAVPDPLVLP